MMNFKTIGLCGKHHHPGVQNSLLVLITLLEERNIKVILETKCFKALNLSKHLSLPQNELSQHCDLVIAVGGDGSLLNMARDVLQDGTPIVGVNRGRLGFLTDILPINIKEEVANILEGHYQIEERVALYTEVWRENKKISNALAINDVVLHAIDIARMLRLEVFVDDHFVFQQHSDGLIVATPTGSTAYALSGGGPIINPKLEAIALVPMHSHNLSSRPIVLDHKSEITIKVLDENPENLGLSCDAQIKLPLKRGDKILIKACPQKLRVLHPKSYDYYETLRSKLSWNIK